MKTDNIVEQVKADLSSRSALGIIKYGTTLEENNTDDFLQHLYEELLDAACYIKKLQNIKNENNRRMVSNRTLEAFQ